MANNRLYIGCQKCRKWLYLDKHFGTEFHISDEKCKELNDFLEEHAYCNSGHQGGISFELFDEVTSDTKTWRYYMEKDSKEET